MRVIAGKLKSRIFDSPGTAKTHPMSEKARGGIFNALGDIEGLTVLDAYSGSGALSFEAISRGARSSIAVEQDKSAYKTLLSNIFTLRLESSIQASLSSMRSWSLKHQVLLFDLVICDPPYDAVLALEIEKLSSHLKPSGLLVLSWPVILTAPVLPKFVILSEKQYAGARIIFYRKDYTA